MGARMPRLATAIVIAAALMGCAHAPKPLYKSDSLSPESQLHVLEGQMLKARAAGAVLPPGFRAHLAMVYLRLGRPDEARVQLEAEKASFPESSAYMDFLLKGMAAPKV